MQLIQNSPEWLEWRKNGIGASEVAAIIGICPYKTAYELWREKTGRSQGFQGNSFTFHGQEMESRARNRYELINMEDMNPACATHPLYPVCRASLDGVSADGKLILEIKCPKGTTVLQAAKENEVIDHYKPQVQFQLAVTGADRLHFFVYHDETRDHALVQVEPQPVYQGLIIAKVLNFWERHVLTDKPPALSERDVKEINDNLELMDLCTVILQKKDTFSKSTLDALKKKAIELGGHNKIRCGRVQISTVYRQGKFSFHKLTIQGENND